MRRRRMAAETRAAANEYPYVVADSRASSPIAQPASAKATAPLHGPDSKMGLGASRFASAIRRAPTRCEAWRSSRVIFVAVGLASSLGARAAAGSAAPDRGGGEDGRRGWGTRAAC